MATQEPTEKRERSSIKFPYGDLDDAVQVARTVHANYGLNCTMDQLAAALDQTTTSGAFRMRVNTAQTFGVITYSRGQIGLTATGRLIADPQTAASARADAFLAVPLYARIFEQYQGGRLPDDAGLEATMVRLGVSAKQASKARQAFQRSARQAGFFNQGSDRLVRPAAIKVEPEEIETPPPEPSGGAGLKVEVSQNPILVGLFNMLPAPGSGAFPPEKQKQWLEAVRVNIELLYAADEPSGSRAADSPNGSSEPEPPA